MSALTVISLTIALAATGWALFLWRSLRRTKGGSRRGEPLRNDDASGGATDESLQEYRQELRHILDRVPDAFFRVDSRWRTTFLNEGALVMLERMEMSEDDLLGQRLWDVFPYPPDDLGRRSLETAMAERTTESREIYFDQLDAWLEIRAFPLYDGLAVYVGDVTDRKEAEQSLRETERRFRAIVENAPEAILVMDAEQEKVVDFNENARQLFERSEDEIRGAMPFQFSPERQPDGRRSVKAAREQIERALAGETPTLDWVHLTGEGRKVHTEVRLARVPSGEGKLIQANIRDVTDRKRAEEALRESEERYRTLFEQDVSGNFVTSADGRILACNSAFARIFGFESVDEAEGSDAVRLHATSDQRDRLLHQIREQGQVDFFELEGRKLDGTLLHLVENVQGVFDPEGRLTELRGHVVDVTDKKELEEQLQQAQRLEAVGRLAGGVAHDFNNLLTTVTGHADLLLTDDRLTGELRDDVRRIKRASRKAARLTSQLVAFSRKQTLKPVVLDLNDVVRDVAEMLHRTIGEDVRLTLRPNPDLRAVRADPGQLEQVLMNLALNARDAMPRGGTLEIATRNVVFEEEEKERPREVDPGRYAAMEVRDTGEGIPESEMDKIFDPFYTTKGPGKGSGLGLAMVYGIARQSEGHVLLDSEVGAGTTFTVLLPVADRGTEERDTQPSHESVNGGSWSILLIQHDPVVRKLVRRILHREGHSVLEAEDPDDAIAFCREWQGEIHCVVSDLLTSDHERGLRTALARHRPEARILWTRESSTEARPRNRTGEAILSKPFSSHQLSRRVRHLQGDDPLPEHDAAGDVG